MNPNQRKLSNAQVIEIRRRYQPYVVTYRALAREYGVSQTLIQMIIERRVRRGIEPDVTREERTA